MTDLPFILVEIINYISDLEEILSNKNMLSEECVMFILNVNVKFLKNLEAINWIIFWPIVPGVLTRVGSSNDDHDRDAGTNKPKVPLGCPLCSHSLSHSKFLDTAGPLSLRFSFHTMSHNGIPQHATFDPGFSTRIIWRLWDLSMLLHTSTVRSFWLLRSNPWYERTVIC